MSWQAQLLLTLGSLRLDLELAGGARPVALIGPNGAGKSTLLRALVGAVEPEAGRIQIADRLVYETATNTSLPPEQRRVGYVPQGSGLFPHLRVIDNVAFGRASKEGKRAARQHALRLLDTLDCGALAERWPAQLSGGERQRVALARALAVEPALLLLDEPLSALDASARPALRRTLRAHLQARGVATLFVTHDLRDVLALDAEVHVLENGRVIQSGSARALADAPETPFVAEFFQSDLQWPPAPPTQDTKA